jgi:putative peptidoglycan lipid II flippase
MKLGVSLGTLAALQMAASLAMQLLVFAALGAGTQTDCWVAAQTVPLILFTISSVTFQGAWQPRFAVLADQPPIWRKAQAAAHGQLLLVVGTAALLLTITADVWPRWLFPGFMPEQMVLTAQVTRILLLGALINCQVALLSTALRAREQFIRAEVLVLAVALATVALTAPVVRHFGVEGVAWLNVARATTVCGALFWMAGRPWPRVHAGWHDRVHWKLVRPLLLGSSLTKTSPIVDRYWSSLAPVGGMTAFSFIHTGMSAVATILERSLCMPVHPRLARLADARDLSGMRALYRARIGRVALMTGVALGALVLLWPFWPQITRPILKLDDATLMETWWWCVVLTGYVLPSAAGSVVVSSFYALGDTATPMRVSAIGFVLSVLAKAAGFALAGMLGLAGAIVAHYVGNLLVMCWLLERRLAMPLPAAPGN